MKKEKNQAQRKEERRQYAYKQMEAPPPALTREQIAADVAKFLKKKKPTVLPSAPAPKPVTAGKRSKR